MNTPSDLAPVPLEVLQQQALSLANEITDKVFRAESPRRVSVVLEALGLLYMAHVRMMPPEAHGACAMHLGELAGQLLQSGAQQATQASAH